jgi:hypothetical protein
MANKGKANGIVMKESQPNIKPDYYRPPINPYVRQYAEKLGSLALRPLPTLPERKA